MFPLLGLLTAVTAHATVLVPIQGEIADETDLEVGIHDVYVALHATQTSPEDAAVAEGVIEGVEFEWGAFTTYLPLEESDLAGYVDHVSASGATYDAFRADTRSYLYAARTVGSGSGGSAYVAATGGYLDRTGGTCPALSYDEDTDGGQSYIQD